MEDYLLGLYEKSMPGDLTLEQKLVEAGKAGFDYMELSIDETDDRLARLEWSNDEIQKLLAAEYETGIPIKSICLSGHRRFPLGHPDPDVQQKSLAIMQNAITLSAKLGVRIIQIAGYDIYYGETSKQTQENFARNLKISAKMAARQGVILAFETMETEFINTVKKAMYWVEKVQSPYLQVYPDIGNLTNSAVKYGSDVLEDLCSGRGHLAALHLKETLPGVFREVPYGTGHVNFSAAAAQAFKLGISMFVGEFWYTGEENWRQILKDNNVFLRDALHDGYAASLEVKVYV